MKILIYISALLVSSLVMAEEVFTQLADDGIHDPTSPAFSLLQEPSEALANLPRGENDSVDWVQTLQNGHISPRMSIDGKKEMKSVELDLVLENTASMPHVKFGHKAHTQWLTCSNCHSRIFLPQKGANFITKNAILKGKYCGVCHGSVAFPIQECSRCHTEKKTAKGLR